MNIGVLAVQGAVEEHVVALEKAAKLEDIEIQVIPVRTPADLELVQGIIIPGGESTTMSRLLRSSGIQVPLIARANAGDLAVFGTCAGMILLASKASHDVADKDIELLGLLDARVNRNAFGRQRESFQATLQLPGIEHLPAVFIRAPVLEAVWGDTEEWARSDRGIIAAKKGKILATAFHPELTPDVRLHQLFLQLAA